MADLMRDRVVAAIGDAYDIEGEIGRGGMGIVYRGRDVRLRRPVGIKVLPPELAFRGQVRTRFLREAETAAQLNHPNIVPIYSVDEREGLVYFVMGLVEGESLAALLARTPILPISTVVHVLRDVLSALAYAHDHGIVHRDIKPDNILLDRATGRAVVSDFGIARVMEGDASLTVTGVAVGTPAYMSPEQALGEREIDGRSDLYSLGVVAYQMLTGAPPFSASNTPAMLMKHIGERPRPIAERRPDAPTALAAAVERALAKRAADRWESAATFRDAVEQCSALGARPSAGRTEYRTPSAERRAPSEPNPLPARAPRSEAWGAPPMPQPPPYPNPANFADRGAWREARKVWKMQMRAYAGATRKRWRGPSTGEWLATRPVEERIGAFRRRLVGTGATVGFLAMINLATAPHFWWWLFPAVGMGMGLMRQWGALWSDGISLKQIFGRRERATLPPPPPKSIAEEAASLASPEVLSGKRGVAIRRAVEDRRAIRETIDRLGKADRELIPDVAPTADALVAQIAGLAQALHRMDEDVTTDSLAQLDARIAVASRNATEGPERERQLALLQRQRASLQDLLDRRKTLEAKLESTSLVLQNLRLDLLKLRSAGVQASIDDVSSATQEARAVSREIGHVLEAAKDLRGER